MSVVEIKPNNGQAKNAKRSASAHRVDNDSALPKIRIIVGKPDESIEAAVSALRADPELYVRDIDLVHVKHATPDEQNDSTWQRGDGRRFHGVIEGTPRIHVMTLATLRVRMCKWAMWERLKETKEGPQWVKCEPTRAMAEELRDERSFPGIRPLVGIAETPFPRPDLTIVQGAAGYDPATGYLFKPGQSFDAVPDNPTRADAARAREALEDVFADFPFAHPAGRSAAIALAMTVICRPAIHGPVPAGIIDATTPGTGKTLLADVISAIALGREAGRSHFPSVTGREADAELSKQLGVHARDGAPLVCFDNADEAVIGGDVLEEVITSRNKYKFRILGKSEGLNLPVRMLFLVTANNATWSRGMNRRVLHIRLESTLENPEHRPLDTYLHPERAGRLFEYVLERRAELVRHMLTIIRAYAVAGCPNQLTLGTFEAWARLVASAIVWSGGVDPMLCRPAQSGEESPETLQRRTIVREWAAFCRDAAITGITAHDMVARLYPPRDHGEPLDPKWETLRGAIEYFVPPSSGRAPDPIKLAETISKRLRGAPVRTEDAPAPLRRFASDGKAHGGRAKWKIEDVQSVDAGATSGEHAATEPISSTPPAPADRAAPTAAPQPANDATTERPKVAATRPIDTGPPSDIDYGPDDFENAEEDPAEAWPRE